MHTPGARVAAPFATACDKHGNNSKGMQTHTHAGQHLVEGSRRWRKGTGIACPRWGYEKHVCEKDTVMSEMALKESNRVVGLSVDHAFPNVYEGCIRRRAFYQLPGRLEQVIRFKKRGERGRMRSSCTS